MKKVGILTYHSSINNGAFLQAFSLQRFLQERYSQNAVVEIIDYETESSIGFYDELSKTEQGRKRKESFCKCRELLTLSERLVSDDLSAVQKFIHDMDYDVIIVGSDEVWKTDNFRGFPNAYWLNYDVGNAKRLAYAVSGRNDYSKCNEFELSYMKEAISKFEYIGTRDEITKKEINKLSDVDVDRNCDPTLLYSESLSEYRKFSSFESELVAEIVSSRRKKKVLLFIRNAPLASYLYRMFRNENEVYNLFSYKNDSDVDIFAINPFEWSELIANADLVITDLFHGTVFSLIHKRPFISIENAELGRGKIEGILSEHNLEYLCFHFDCNKEIRYIGMEIYTFGHKILREGISIPYGEIISSEKKKSNGFLSIMDEIVGVDNE
jgi:hypothetical protein